MKHPISLPVCLKSGKLQLNNAGKGMKYLKEKYDFCCFW
jgi:hypothetical protein